MSNISVKEGNIFTSECQTLVNTVNCDGVMGRGIALEFRLRRPAMFAEYVKHCKAKRLDIGKLWIYKPPPSEQDKRWTLNFPTKRHWKYPSKKEYLESGLQKFVATYRDQHIESIAFPTLGTANGGLFEDEVIPLMKSYLEKCDIPVEIYLYKPDAGDDLYLEFCKRVLSERNEEKEKKMAKAMDLRVDRLRKIRDAVQSDLEIQSLSQLAKVPGIGLKSLEKCFHFTMRGFSNAGTRAQESRQSHVTDDSSAVSQLTLFTHHEEEIQ